MALGQCAPKDYVSFATLGALLVLLSNRHSIA